jgi:hypothetical protein
MAAAAEDLNIGSAGGRGADAHQEFTGAGHWQGYPAQLYVLRFDQVNDAVCFRSAYG